MSEEAAFLAAIRANPADDLPRLVYADWLDERGQGERAELIRTPGRLTFKKVPSGWMQTGGECVIPRLEAAALASLPDAWPAGIEVVFRHGFWTEVRCTRADWCGCPECGGKPPRPVTAGPVRVSFGGGATVTASNVTSSCGVCRGRGQAIGPRVVAAHPLDRVVLTDRKPLFTRAGREGPGDWAWVREDIERDPHDRDLPAQHLPPDVWDRLEGYDTSPSARTRARRYPTRDAAMLALSPALIAWAKGQNETPATYERFHDRLLGEIARGVPPHLPTDTPR
jgi:uncharacterized protein (TIGR02996 family)